MKTYSLLHLFKAFHPELYTVSGNTTIAETRAKTHKEAVSIFRDCFKMLNERGYFKQDEVNSYCVAENYPY